MWKQGTTRSWRSKQFVETETDVQFIFKQNDAFDLKHAWTDNDVRMW